MDSSSRAQAGADSSLVRLLLDWGIAEVSSPGPDWAPRLAGWLDAFGAIELDAAQKSMPQAASPAASRRARTAAPEAILRQVREDLETAIAAPDPFEPDLGPLPGEAKRAEASSPDGQDFRAHRSRYLALQRRMDTKIGTAREKVREALGRAGPELARLAMLDAALERTLGVQMQARFAALPRLLELRFARSREIGSSDPGGPSGPDFAQPAARRGEEDPGRTGACFARDVEALLRAELEVRLAPVEGMVEAFGRKAGEWR